MVLRLGKVMFWTLWELIKLFPRTAVAVVLGSIVVPWLLPTFLEIMQIDALIAIIILLACLYLDMKDNIVNDRFGVAVRNIAAKFSPDNDPGNAPGNAPDSNGHNDR